MTLDAKTEAELREYVSRRVGYLNQGTTDDFIAAIARIVGEGYMSKCEHQIAMDLYARALSPQAGETLSHDTVKPAASEDRPSGPGQAGDNPHSALETLAEEMGKGMEKNDALNPEAGAQHSPLGPVRCPKDLGTIEFDDGMDER